MTNKDIIKEADEALCKSREANAESREIILKALRKNEN